MSTSVPSNDSSGGTHDPAAHPTSPGPNPDDVDQDRHPDADRAEHDADVDAVPRTPPNPGPNPDDLDQ